MSCLNNSICNNVSPPWNHSLLKGGLLALNNSSSVAWGDVWVTRGV